MEGQIYIFQKEAGIFINKKQADVPYEQDDQISPAFRCPSCLLHETDKGIIDHNTDKQDQQGRNAVVAIKARQNDQSIACVSAGHPASNVLPHLPKEADSRNYAYCSATTDICIQYSKTISCPSEFPPLYSVLTPNHTAGYSSPPVSFHFLPLCSQSVCPYRSYRQGARQAAAAACSFPAAFPKGTGLRIYCSGA